VNATLSRYVDPTHKRETCTGSDSPSFGDAVLVERWLGNDLELGVARLNRRVG
jgi:hypothetical protein